MAQWAQWSSEGDWPGVDFEILPPPWDWSGTVACSDSISNNATTEIERHRDTAETGEMVFYY